MSPSLALIRNLLYRFFAPGRLLRETYRAFREVLEHDHRSHERLAWIERLYQDRSRVDFCAVSRGHEALSQAVSGMIRNLDAMVPRSYTGLFSVFQGIDASIRGSALRFEGTEPSTPLAVPLTRLPPGSVAVAGGKAANLSGIAADLNLPVPRGFVLTTRAFDLFCEFHHLRPTIEAALAGLDIDSLSSLEAASAQITSAIRSATLPPDIEKAIRDAWLLTFGEPVTEGTQSPEKKPLRCAVRSSAVGEDAAFSFAGQYATVLNVDPSRVGGAYKEVIASKYSPNALLYRIRNGFLDQETPMAVLVLEMVDAVASGIVYSRSPVVPGSPALTLYSVWGLGEPLVRGGTVPDVMEVSRDGSGAHPQEDARHARKQGGPRALRVALKPCRWSPGKRNICPWMKPRQDNWPLGPSGWKTISDAPQDTEWCQDRAGGSSDPPVPPPAHEPPGEDSCRIVPPTFQTRFSSPAAKRLCPAWAAEWWCWPNPLQT